MNKDDDRYEYGSYLRSNEHSLSSSENKAWKKFRPVRNNKNNSILAKFATYDGFMVKKKILAFLNLSSRRSKMPTLFAEFHLKKKPNLLADSKTCRLNIVTTILSLASLRTDTT